MNDDWLKQLAPAHAPVPPGWWPLAPGWWMLALLLMLTIGLAVWWRRRLTWRRRRAALRELDSLATLTNDRHLAVALQNLMRRYALAAYGRAAVVTLSGEAWLAFVVERGGQVLAGAPGEALLRAAWGGAMTTDRTLWLEGARGFLRGRA